MITIENPLHVETLFLTWQSNSDRNQRYLVGVLKKAASGFEFSYLVDTPDYITALEHGFMGYPAFRLGGEVYTNDVMTTFMKRLPPRSRRDFRKYLTNHYLSENFDGSDFDLISHTGIQLPSDGFDLVPDLSEAQLPFDYLMEVAGSRYYITGDEAASIGIGTQVRFECENDNEFDCNAVALFIGTQPIGYINKLICPAFRELMTRDISCHVAKVSGTVDRPLIFVMFSAK
ncbi:hypothetical protein [Vibrio atlanticus]|uniref:HIRAN domain-containing protein n=1 Tax=Vibrio atlanticus (strain LGP32) TaxID=575788 RepID=B7VMR4_VIBA3|nr:hypothetical protein [Vibrio atlanticus]CAV18315.1 hypothetical protein VS_1189 [Vibrio atlanticus]